MFTACNNSSPDQNIDEDVAGDVNAREEIPQTEAIREAPENDMQQDTATYDDENTQTQPVQDAQSETASNANQQMKPVEGGVTSVGVSYNDWDVNNDRILNDKEFYEGFYKVWDADGDNNISGEEFNTATNDFFANYNYTEYGEYDDWDTNMNSELNLVEFQNKMLAILSSDSENQTAERLMTIWNLDNDSSIERIDLQNVTVMLDKNDN